MPIQHVDDIRLDVPSEVGEDLRALAERHLGGGEPCLIPVEPSSWSQPFACGYNVAVQCSLHGGDPVKGWRIWCVPGVLVEAQAHVVWRQPDGFLVDLTPNTDGERTCCFTPDLEMAENPGVDAVPSRLLNLCGDPAVDEYIRCSKNLQALDEQRRIRGPNPALRGAIEAAAKQQMALRAKMALIVKSLRL